MITISDLSLNFSGEPLFKDVNLKFTQGNCYGVIGANGAGKSTFLRILSGDLDPSTGTVSIAPKTRMSVLKQDHFAFNEETVLNTVLGGNERLLEVMREKDALYMKDPFTEEDGNKAAELESEFAEMGGWDAETEASQLLNGLGLDADAILYTEMKNLGDVEKVKVLLARALFGKPDILLLDEPTNYLDEEHIVWLKRYLQEYENAFILISHDIPFLNSVINLIYHMDNLKLTRYVGDYNNFREVYEMKKSQQEAAYNRQQKEIAELKDFISRNKARVATRNMAMSRQKKLDNMELIEKTTEKPKPEFEFQTARMPGRYIFKTEKLVIGYDEPLSSPLDLEMERGSRIVLTGANGIGKSTLLKSLLGLIKPLDGKVEQGDYLHIGYFEQETPQDIRTTCIEEIWNEFPSMDQREVRAALAKCGLTTMHIESKVKVLSGGEQAKVRLCKLINRPSNVLVLDEPTNHLDTDAKDELKRALLEYKGSILMVCHEPEFYEDIATDVWDCTQWTTKLV